MIDSRLACRARRPSELQLALQDRTTPHSAVHRGSKQGSTILVSTSIYDWLLFQSSAASASWHDRKLLLLFPRGNPDVADAVLLPRTSMACRVPGSFWMQTRPVVSVLGLTAVAQAAQATVPSAVPGIRNVARLPSSSKAAGPQDEKETSKPASSFHPQGHPHPNSFSGPT